MTGRLLLAAALAGTAWMTAGTASACDPNRFPNCQTYCGAVASRYTYVKSSLDDKISPQPLPAWPHTGVAGCP